MFRVQASPGNLSEICFTQWEVGEVLQSPLLIACLFDPSEVCQGPMQNIGVFVLRENSLNKGLDVGSS